MAADHSADAIWVAVSGELTIASVVWSLYGAVSRASVEATARGVTDSRVDSRTDEMRSVRLHYHHDDKEQVLAYAAGRVGMKYSFFNAFFCGLRHVFPGVVQIKFGNQVICSELVAESLERAGFDWGKDSALVSPGDLAEQLGLPRR